MDLNDLILLGLATSQVVITWNTGSIFAAARAWVQVRSDILEDDELEQRRTWAGWLLSWPLAILQCPFCLSHHIAVLLFALCCVPKMLSGSDWWLSPLVILGAIQICGLVRLLYRFAPADITFETRVIDHAGNPIQLPANAAWVADDSAYPGEAQGSAGDDPGTAGSDLRSSVEG